MHVHSVFRDHAYTVKPLNALEVLDSLLSLGDVWHPKPLESSIDVMDLKCATVPHALPYVFDYAHVCTQRGHL